MLSQYYFTEEKMNFDKLDHYLCAFLALGVPGCDCSVYQHGKEIFRKQYGFRDLNNRLPVEGSERYHIYSCSKPITCVAALQLWEKGLFKLDDPLAGYMPEFRDMLIRTPEGPRPAKNPITIRHLFCMTAGFDYNYASPSLRKAYDETMGCCPTRETMRYLAREPLVFEPGTSWQYSLCHDVLAAFTEVISGKNFEALLQENIFAPLGMKDTTFLLPAAEVHTVAPLYFNSSRGVLLHPQHPMQGNHFRLGARYASGGAGGVSTVNDYIKFLEAWRTDRLICRETRELMTKEHLNLEDFPSLTLADKDYSYGLGVRVPKKGQSRIRDFGWGGAAGSFLAVIPEAEVSFFYAQHLLVPPNISLLEQLPSVIMECVEEKK